MKHQPKLIYIASTYSIGNKLQNVMRSMRIADKLISLGHYPYCPLLNHFQNKYFPREESEWLALDIVWLKKCDIVLRLPGESSGADREVKVAKVAGIPVIYFDDGQVFSDLEYKINEVM
jgi:hypothetical protein